MGLCRIFLRLTAVLVALFAILVGCLVADVPGQLGLWRYLDSVPFSQGVVPFVHQGAWGFNHSTLGPKALAGRTFLVTGANAGLGYGTAHYLASHSGTVIMGCRSQKNCDEAVQKIKKDVPKANLIPLAVDFASFSSIKQFAVNVLQKTEKLHSLILNAGIAQWPYELTEDGLEQHMGVNHFGQAYLTQLLEDLIKRTATPQFPATIVLVSSGLHGTSYPEGVHLSLESLNDPTHYDRGLAYGESKLANVLYAQELAVRLKADNILVNSLNPGFVLTNIGNHIGERIQRDYPKIADMAVRSGLVDKFLQLMTSVAWNAMDAALTQVYAAVSPELLSKRITGQYFNPIARLSVAEPLHATNATLQKRFWDFTQQVLKAKAK